MDHERTHVYEQQRQGGFIATSYEKLTNEHPPEHDPGYAWWMGMKQNLLLGLGLLRGLGGVCEVPAVGPWWLVPCESCLAFRLGNPFAIYDCTCRLRLFSVL